MPMSHVKTIGQGVCNHDFHLMRTAFQDEGFHLPLIYEIEKSPELRASELVCLEEAMFLRRSRFFYRSTAEADDVRSTMLEACAIPPRPPPQQPGVLRLLFFERVRTRQIADASELCRIAQHSGLESWLEYESMELCVDLLALSRADVVVKVFGSHNIVSYFNFRGTVVIHVYPYKVLDPYYKVAFGHAQILTLELVTIAESDCERGENVSRVDIYEAAATNDCWCDNQCSQYWLGVCNKIRIERRIFELYLKAAVLLHKSFAISGSPSHAEFRDISDAAQSDLGAAALDETNAQLCSMSYDGQPATFEHERNFLLCEPAAGPCETQRQCALSVQEMVRHKPFGGQADWKLCPFKALLDESVTRPVFSLDEFA